MNGRAYRWNNRSFRGRTRLNASSRNVDYEYYVLLSGAETDSLSVSSQVLARKGSNLTSVGRNPQKRTGPYGGSPETRNPNLILEVGIIHWVVPIHRGKKRDSEATK